MGRSEWVPGLLPWPDQPSRSRRVRGRTLTPPHRRITAGDLPLGDLRDIVDDITTKGASVHFVKEQQTYSRDTDDAIGRLTLNLLGAFAGFERTPIRERQREGIRIAKTAGKYKGRARKLADDQIEEARQRVSAGVPKTTIARDFGIDRTTLYRMLATSRSPAAAETIDDQLDPRIG